MADSFLQNNFVLVYRYKVGSTTNTLSWRFDNIVNMKANIDMGLYTEGNGNLKYSKGATNPVTFVFRKTLELGNDTTGITTTVATTDSTGTTTTNTTATPKTKNRSAPFTGFRRFSVEGRKLASITGGSGDETSIFEWAAELNSNSNINEGDAILYAAVTESEAAASSYSKFLTLSRAFPLSAIIKRNPYRGVNVAELTFVADSMSTTSLTAAFSN